MNDKILKVMYAEDDEDIRLIAKISMETGANMMVEDYPDGQKLFERLMNVNPDIIVLDAKMPELGGCETLRKIRELKRFDNLPVIFLTSSLDDEDLARYYSLGAAGVIAKPFDPGNLANQIISIYNANKVVSKYLT